MKRFIAFATALCLVFCLTGCKKNKLKYTDYTFDYFDTATTIVGYAGTQEEFDLVCDEIKELLGEYHKLYNIYNRYDGVTNLCSVNNTEDGVHKELKVDKKIIDLLLYAKELYTLTNGKMNVAMGSVLSIWHDYRTEGINNPNKASLPPMDRLKEAAKHTDINDLIINREKSTVYLKDSKMSLDVGAIAKGYATEQIALYLEQKGISGYLLNVGGNVRCIGKRADGEEWKVGVENPETQDDYLAYLKLSDKSIVTSGNYQRYYTVNGVNYHHIINPETLMPATNFRSVSVICKDSGKADALSTALFNMTYREGSELVENLAGIEAMWVLPDGKQLYSDGFNTFTYENE
ncbi:MAG: FAD:protein FMN transferase [Clostridia bacterium]|nr:FAD:protein FMN transferase [Clostridia bacterium]